MFSNENNLGFHARYHLFENFDDYPALQPKITQTKHFSQQCTYFDPNSLTSLEMAAQIVQIPKNISQWYIILIIAVNLNS